MPKPNLKNILRSILPLSLAPFSTSEKGDRGLSRFRLKKNYEIEEDQIDSPLLPVYKACLNLILQITYKNIT